MLIRLDSQVINCCIFQLWNLNINKFSKTFRNPVKEEIYANVKRIEYGQIWNLNKFYSNSIKKRANAHSRTQVNQKNS